MAKKTTKTEQPELPTSEPKIVQVEPATLPVDAQPDNGQKVGPTAAITEALKSIGPDATNDRIKLYCEKHYGMKADDWGTGFYVAKKAALKKMGVDVPTRGRTSGPAPSATLKDLVAVSKAVKTVIDKHGRDALNDVLELVAAHDAATIKEVADFLTMLAGE